MGTSPPTWVAGSCTVVYSIWRAGVILEATYYFFSIVTNSVVVGQSLCSNFPVPDAQWQIQGSKGFSRSRVKATIWRVLWRLEAVGGRKLPANNGDKVTEIWAKLRPSLMLLSLQLVTDGCGSLLTTVSEHTHFQQHLQHVTDQFLAIHFKHKSLQDCQLVSFLFGGLWVTARCEKSWHKSYWKQLESFTYLNRLCIKMGLPRNLFHSK